MGLQYAFEPLSLIAMVFHTNLVTAQLDDTVSARGRLFLGSDADPWQFGVPIFIGSSCGSFAMHFYYLGLVTLVVLEVGWHFSLSLPNSVRKSF